MAHLKCIYTSAYSLGNKQEEMEAIMQQETVTYLLLLKNCGVTPMSGMLQCTAINSSEGIGKERGAVAWISVLESVPALQVEAGNDKVESLWVRIGGVPSRKTSL